MDFPEALKEMIRKKANLTCCWCRDPLQFVEIHHIIAQAEDGSDSEENAAPLCPNCHRKYRDNPHLRKEIRRRRDFWFEKCKDVNIDSSRPFAPTDKFTKRKEREKIQSAFVHWEIDMFKLTKGIDKLFSVSEFKDLCFQVGIDYDHIPGKAGINKSRELVKFCQRRGQILHLKERCRELRPFIDW